MIFCLKYFFSIGNLNLIFSNKYCIALLLQLALRINVTYKIRSCVLGKDALCLIFFPWLFTSNGQFP